MTKRKHQWRQEAEAREAAKPDPHCPPGHVALSEEERASSLERLRANYDKTVAELAVSAGMPCVRACVGGWVCVCVCVCGWVEVSETV